MGYEKMSAASFAEALKKGKYGSATGARRAVGKSVTLTEAEKDQARKLVDDHFGDSAKPSMASLKPVKKAAKAAGEAPKTDSSPKEAAVFGSSVTQSIAGSAAVAKAVVKNPTYKVKSESSFVSEEELDLSDVTTQLNVAERVAAQQSAALSALASAKTAYPGVDVSEKISQLSNDLADAISVFRGVIQSIKAKQAVEIFRETAENGEVPETSFHPLNGVSHTVRGEALFRDSLPPS